MDERLVQQIQDVAYSDPQDIKSDLAEALTQFAGAPLTVRGARDKLSSVLNKARQGDVQLIGTTPEEMTVVMSLADLAKIVIMTAKTQSFGEALTAMGFQPVPQGVRRRIRKDRPNTPLKRYRGESEPNSGKAM